MKAMFSHFDCRDGARVEAGRSPPGAVTEKTLSRQTGVNTMKSPTASGMTAINISYRQN